MSSSKASPASAGAGPVFSAGLPAYADFDGQTALIEKLATDFQLGQFVHAYLFAGPEGVGKRTLAWLCIQTLYCAAQEKPCGLCGECHRIQSGSHPDIQVLRPDGNSLKIEQIREMIEAVQLRSFAGGAKVILIEDADKMTVQAQNCLLKTLETPPPDTIFFLLCETVGALLPTIRSRCRVVSLRPLDDAGMMRRLAARGITGEQARSLTVMAGGCVGKALAWAADQQRQEARTRVLQDFFSMRSAAALMQVSAGFRGERSAAQEALLVLQEAVGEGLRLKLNGTPPPRDLYPRAWWDFTARVDHPALLRLSLALVEGRKRLASNVQPQMVMESVLLQMLHEQSESAGGQ